MNKKVFRGVCVLSSILLMLASCDVFAQSKLLSAVSYAEFRYDSTLTYVEVYTSISPAKLTYHSVQNGNSEGAGRLVSVAKLKYEFRNLSTDSTVVVTDNIPIGVNDTSSIGNTSRFVTITRLLFVPGEYTASIYATDGDSSTVADSANFKLEVRKFPGSRLSVSDIELCSEISNLASEKDVYSKNMLRVVPNPKALYGLGMPTVPYYAEIYGLGRRGDTTEYAITWNVVDTYGRVVKSRSSLKTGSSPNVVEIGSTNISDLPSGRYALELTVADSTTKALAATSEYFFVYNPYVKQPQIAANANIDVLSSPFFRMGEKELDDSFYAASYLATPQQTNFYKKLTTVDAKRRFLAQFWAEQDRKAGPGGYNSWNEFERRFKYASEKYGTAFKAGWITDRGRVYIDNGKPDDIERHPSSSNSKPYQIWTYNAIQGGVIFVFVDLTGFNDYILVHSTKRGEVENPDWQRYVQTSR